MIGLVDAYVRRATTRRDVAQADGCWLFAEWQEQKQRLEEEPDAAHGFRATAVVREVRPANKHTRYEPQ